MRMGELSRCLLPFGSETSVSDQAASGQAAYGSSELDGRLDNATRKEMVLSATSLRSLVRVKIADDADLMQVRVHTVRVLSIRVDYTC